MPASMATRSSEIDFVADSETTFWATGFNPPAMILMLQDALSRSIAVPEAGDLAVSDCYIWQQHSDE